MTSLVNQSSDRCLDPLNDDSLSWWHGTRPCFMNPLKQNACQEEDSNHDHDHETLSRKRKNKQHSNSSYNVYNHHHNHQSHSEHSFTTKNKDVQEGSDRMGVLTVMAPPPLPLEDGRQDLLIPDHLHFQHHLYPGDPSLVIPNSNGCEEEATYTPSPSHHQQHYTSSIKRHHHNNCSNKGNYSNGVDSFLLPSSQLNHHLLHVSMVNTLTSGSNYSYSSPSGSNVTTTSIATLPRNIYGEATNDAATLDAKLLVPFTPDSNSILTHHHNYSSVYQSNPSPAQLEQQNSDMNIWQLPPETSVWRSTTGS